MRLTGRIGQPRQRWYKAVVKRKKSN
ncbi:hypothetical protein CAEBREN_06558 [Caenorhabditis brenneri]|uniref:Uncharacterized protein n=1 Tax=Caenorhabditis brenneri TaxID=135651 RepID=G0MID0_CAEBE|nr:hypothetical protein CAEBREN_06558 [Caenorhabditis brenneri]